LADRLTFKCATCDEVHVGPFDLACHRPEQWQGGDEYAPNSVVQSSAHFLSEDFCVLEGRHYFVRCVLELPIIGRPGERFAYGVWSTLSRENFQLYVESFDTGFDEEGESWFGWFSNRLTGYPDTLNLKCDVFPQPGRQRPCVRLRDSEHLLAIEARQGVTLDRLLEIYRKHGHDVKIASLDTH
jgi:hypothetical protein